MVIENAFLFKVASKLHLGKFYVFIWRRRFVRNLLNINRKLSLKFSKKNILNSASPAMVRIANDLKNKGIAKAHISEFSGMPNIINLQQEYEVLLDQDNSNPHDRKSKSFIQRLVDDDFKFKNKDSALTEYLLNEDIAKACAMYLGLVPKLTSFKIWRSHQTEISERSASQNWHRDYNEYQMIRIFLYFNEVNSNNGAGEYVLGTHYLGDSYDTLQDSEDGVSRYSTESDVNKAFSRDRLVTAEGAAGTLYFVDTAGLHRGGYHPVPGERRVALTTFSTAADLMETKVRKPKNIKLTNFMKKVLI
jgi:hypothetical protein